MADQEQEKSGFSYYFKTIYPLVVLAVFIGVALGVAYKYMGPIIEATQAREEKKALSAVVQGASDFKVMTNLTIADNKTNARIYYEALDASGNRAGLIFKEGAIGYGGPVLTLVGITNGVVESIFILNADQETPGLGNKCMNLLWQKKFAGILEADVPADKAGFDKVEADAITGSTLTSMAVTRNIQAAYELYNIVAGGE